MPDESASQRTLRQRLSELYRRLSGTPRTASAEEAFRELCETLEQVENEFSGVPKPNVIPAPAVADGRMYCPQEDHVPRLPNGDILALTRGHRIEVAVSGSLRIINRVTKLVEFEK
jgi:hypothetical protein